MKNFSAELIEEIRSHHLTVDDSGKKQYLFRDRIGALKRHYSGRWESCARECSSLHEARQWIGKKGRRHQLPSAEPEMPFSPGKMIRDHQAIIDRLEHLNLAHWQVTFNIQQNMRLVINRDRQEFTNRFNHHSILLRLKLNERQDYIELGEGKTEGNKFNRDALCARAESIVRNQREARPLSIKGKVPVILSSGAGGILIHEILGHSLEADYMYQKLSPLSMSDVGRRIVSQGINLLTHDGKDTFFQGIRCDDEGEVPKSILLVEKGILRHVIADCLYQQLLKADQCGHARNMAFSQTPMPRMYALYLEAGDFHPDECIKSTDYGIYAREFGDGKVLFQKNVFFFNIKEAYLIEKGRLTAPLGNTIVQGDIVEVLNSIEMVANDFHYDTGNSYCFKNGQVLNVRVGQPTIKMNNLMISRGDG
jgi:predicted Zn-dependent protease